MIEINEKNYEAVLASMQEYLIKKSFIEREIELKESFDNIFNSSIRKRMFKNEKIKEVVLQEYVFIKKKPIINNLAINKMNHSCLLIPVFIEVVTDKNRYKLKLLGSDIIKEIRKFAGHRLNDEQYKEVLSMLLPRDDYFYAPTKVLNNMANKLIKKAKNSNKFSEKEELERSIVDWKKGGKTDDLFLNVKKKMRVYLKEFFFKRLANEVRFSPIKNELYCHKNYAQDYILYNYLRGKKISCGIKNIKKDTIKYRCFYDNEIYPARLTRLSENMFGILSEVYGINAVLEKCIGEINSLLQEDEILSKYRKSLFKYKDAIMKTNS